MSQDEQLDSFHLSGNVGWEELEVNKEHEYW